MIPTLSYPWSNKLSWRTPVLPLTTKLAQLPVFSDMLPFLMDRRLLDIVKFFLCYATKEVADRPGVLSESTIYNASHEICAWFVVVLCFSLLLFNSLVPGRWVVFKLILVIVVFGISHEISLRWTPDNKPLPEPMLTQIHWWCRHMASLDHNELTRLMFLTVASRALHSETGIKWTPVITHWPLVAICDHMLRIKVLSTSLEIALRWMPQNTFKNKSTLI